MIKANDLLELAVFEFETIMYQAEEYWWQWNKRNNLEGFSKNSDQHIFTWQPHGSQFTIIENVPERRLAIRIKQPPLIEKSYVLNAISFDESWIEVIS